MRRCGSSTSTRRALWSRAAFSTSATHCGESPVAGAAWRRRMPCPPIPPAGTRRAEEVSILFGNLVDCARRSSERQPNRPSGHGHEPVGAMSNALEYRPGTPPEPHEREAVIVTRPRPLGHCADRMARYKEIRQAGAARSVRGARCERDARLRHVEGSDVPHALSDRTRDAASQPARAVRGRPGLETAGRGIARGDCAARLAAPGTNESRERGNL